MCAGGGGFLSLNKNFLKSIGCDGISGNHTSEVQDRVLKEEKEVKNKNPPYQEYQVEANPTQPWANSLIIEPSNFHKRNVSQAMQLSLHFWCESSLIQAKDVTFVVVYLGPGQPVQEGDAKAGSPPTWVGYGTK